MKDRIKTNRMVVMAKMDYYLLEEIKIKLEVNGKRIAEKRLALNN